MVEKKEKKSGGGLISTCLYFLYFCVLFFGTFGFLWYRRNHVEAQHCHILAPLPKDLSKFPEYRKFYQKYKNKFDIVYRNMSKYPKSSIAHTLSICLLFWEKMEKFCFSIFGEKLKMGVIFDQLEEIMIENI